MTNEQKQGELKPVSELQRFLDLSKPHIDVNQVGRFITNKRLEMFFDQTNSRLTELEKSNQELVEVAKAFAQIAALSKVNCGD